VGDLVAEDGFADVLRVALGEELGRVNADDDELVGILSFQLLQVGQYVHAVDAAVGPEIEKDNFPANIGEPDGMIGIKPAQGAVELGRCSVCLNCLSHIICQASGRRFEDRISLYSGWKKGSVAAWNNPELSSCRGQALLTSPINICPASCHVLGFVSATKKDSSIILLRLLNED